MMARSITAFDLLDRWVRLPPEGQKEITELMAREAFRNASPELRDEAMRILREDAAKQEAQAA